MEKDIKQIIERQDGLGKEVRKWLRINKKALLAKLASLNMHEKSALLDDMSDLEKGLKTRTKKKDGFYEWLAFSFPRQGIFIEHGVGRGRPVGSAKARENAQPWLKPILGPAYEDLADILQEEYADIIEDFIFKQIPGILNFENGRN